MTVDKYGGKHFTFVVTEEAKQKIEEQSQLQGITKTEFIVDKALNFQIPDSSTLKTIRKPVRTASYKEAAKKFVAELKTEKEEEIMANKKNGASTKTAQFHLRVSPEVYEQIQKKAADMAMSVSDYVTFVTTKYDIEEVSMKMDKIIEMLENQEKEKKSV